MVLATLPTELYHAIISHVPYEERQNFVLNLTRAIPRSPVPQQALFEHISITRYEQLYKLYTRLSYFNNSTFNTYISEDSTWVKSFTLLPWQIDPETLINLLRILPCLETLNLHIGPSFTPEHLDEILKKDFKFLRSLNIRFRPYVQSARYYQFLAGSYFEPSLDTLTLRSGKSLTSLSIMQDPVPSLPEGIKSFAQPIVFFSLEPFTNLGLSPMAQNITNLRLRVPNRHLVHCFAKTRGGLSASHFPSARLCDLSTCSVESRDLSILLHNIGNGYLQHLILDGTGLCAMGTEWESLGRAFANASIAPARDREKFIKSVIEASNIRRGINADEDEPDNFRDEVRRPRRGRRGLAVATISIRDGEEETTLLPENLKIEKASLPPRSVKIRVLPSPPQLRSICIRLPRQLEGSPHRQEHKERAQREFAKGWQDGISQLRSIWTRLRQSHKNGMRVFAFDPDHGNAQSERSHLLFGLTEVGSPDQESIWHRLEKLEAPLLCLAGARGEDWTGTVNDWSGHLNGCGHNMSFDIWDDNL